MRHPALVVVLVIIAVACGGPQERAPITGSTSSIGGTETTTSPVGRPLPEGFPDNALPSIITDVARRAGVSPNEVLVESFRIMTFNDTSLGCPEPGKMYAQVLTPGFVVTVDAGASELRYRVARGSGTIAMCE